MKISMQRLFALVAVTVGGFSTTAHALTKQDLINRYSSKSDSEVFSILLSTGVGRCFVQDATASAAAVCRYYFHSGSSTPRGYDGVPIYNSDNSNPAGYSGSASASRVSQVAANPLDSTGCFAGMGGEKTNSNSSWIGNNLDEAALTPDVYSKKVLLRMMADAADPCGLNSYITSIQSMARSYNLEQMVTAQNSYIVFTATSAGVVNPRSCRRVTTASGFAYSTPLGAISETSCAVMYQRIIARGDTPRTSTAGSVPTVLSAHSTAYRNAIQADRTSQLASFVAAHPNLFNPASVSSGICNTPTGCFPVAPTAGTAQIPSYSPTNAVMYPMQSVSTAQN